MRQRRLVRERKAAVLNLHRVSPHSSPYWPPLHPNDFEALLKYLDEYFEVRSLMQINEKTGARPIAVLSFDDGYYDFIEYALPLLEKYKMRANMNVIPQCAETGRPIWNVRLYDFLANAPEQLIDRLQIDGFEQKVNVDDANAKLKFGMSISKFLKNRPLAEREALFAPVERLIEQWGTQGTRMMTTEELKQLAGAVDLGAHSYSHESMAFEEQEFFEEDFAECKRYFDRELDSELKIYAFPNGSYRREHIEHLRSQQVEKILLVDEEFADLGSDVVKRITMYGNSPAEVRIRAVSG